MGREFWRDMEDQSALFKGVMEGSASVDSPSHAQATPQATPTTTVVGHGNFEGLGKQGAYFGFLRCKMLMFEFDIESSHEQICLCILLPYFPQWTHR